MRYGTKTVAIPPGATIREQLEDRKMSQKEFAVRMDLSEKHISRLINGQVELTKDVALRLESVLGISANFWNNLEVIFRESLARVKEEKAMESDIKLSDYFPYAKIASMGWVPPSRIKEEKVMNLRRFFEVASLDVLEKLMIPGIACRRTDCSEKCDYHLVVWAQKAKLEARKIETHAINLAKLGQSIGVIREMTKNEPSDFLDDLGKLFSESGVALVFLPHIGGSFLHGASFRDGDRIVMGLTLRGKDTDRFWFSLFHELYHVIRGHTNISTEKSSDNEKEADTFACNTLIPHEAFENFLENSSFSRKSITDFAHSINIAPGIVVGRLQKENYIKYDMFNDLKDKYEFTA